MMRWCSLVKLDVYVDWALCCQCINMFLKGIHKSLVHITWVRNQGSDKHVEPHILARTFTAHRHARTNTHARTRK